jgi:hypothetical protein
MEIVDNYTYLFCAQINLFNFLWRKMQNSASIPLKM